MGLDANIIAQRGLTDNCVLEYFGTLYEVISQFRCSGEEILQRRNGFRSRAWVESLFKVAAEHHCFANRNCPQGLPFEVVQPLITQDLVAYICLAADILETMFYERLLFQQHQELSSRNSSSKAVKETLKTLRIARRKFCKCKMEYIDLAYGPKPARHLVGMYDVCTVHKHDLIQQDIMLALDLMPIVFQTCPRNETAAEMVPVMKLCRKYIRLFDISAEI